MFDRLNLRKNLKELRCWLLVALAVEYHHEKVEMVRHEEEVKREMKANGKEKVWVKVLVCERTSQVLGISACVGYRYELVEQLVWD